MWSFKILSKCCGLLGRSPGVPCFGFLRKEGEDDPAQNNCSKQNANGDSDPDKYFPHFFNSSFCAFFCAFSASSVARKQ